MNNTLTIKRKVLKVLHIGALIYWRIFKPRTSGVRILIFHNKKLLLVEHTYKNNYFAPGGGVKGAETFKEAIIRETKEETGIELTKSVPKLLGIYQNELEGKHDTIVQYIIENLSDEEAKMTENTDLLEIKAVNWFGLDELPENTADSVLQRLDELENGQPPFVGVWVIK